MMKKNNIGVEVNAPKQACDDKKCPFHGNLSVRGNQRVGTVVSDKMRNTVIVEWKWKSFFPKYERYESKKTKIKVHCSPCMGVKLGDKVKIMRCRPLSKTKNHVVVENMGRDIDYLRDQVYAEKEISLKMAEEKMKQQKPKEEPKEE